MDDPESGQSYEAGIQLLQDAVEKIAESPTDTYKYICGHVMTQMSATAGIKKHGQPAVDALLAEFGQLMTKMFSSHATHRSCLRNKKRKRFVQ